MKRPKLEPTPTGAALVESINRSVVGPNEVAVWWLGQSGYVLKTPDVTVYIDPYLSEHLTRKYASTEKPHVRMTKAPLRGSDATNADIVISTHRHSDHMDPGTIPDLLRASPEARYVIPRAHKQHVLGWDVAEERLVLANVDEPLDLAGLELMPIPAAHEEFDEIAGIGYPYMGFVIRLNGLTIYHSGDTVPYPGLVERLHGACLDAAFLPINGRDARRHAIGTPGNCSIEEALCIARVADIPLLVPHHYDMFTFNTVNVEDFKARAQELYPSLVTMVMDCGREHRIRKQSQRATP